MSNLSVQFINRSQEADSYLWEFGDGTSTNRENPEHTYLVGGAYVVTLLASRGEAEAQVSRTVITVGIESDVLLSTATGDTVATADGDFIVVPPP